MDIHETCVMGVEHCKYSVCIKCMTYNQAPYIKDTMDGFCSQVTEFPFVAVIVDDASTDGNQVVILDYLGEHFNTAEDGVSWVKEDDYANYYYARHRNNQNCFFAILLLKKNQFGKASKGEHIKEWEDNSKYIAICEGDDYWTDSLKLQKQVRFLDNNPEFMVCSHDYTRYHQDSHSFDDRTYYSDLFSEVSSPMSIEYSLDTYFDRWWTQPLTCVYRNGEYLKRMPVSSYRFFRDDIFYYYVLKEGKGMLLRDSMGVYRVHKGGVWSGSSRILRNQAAIYNAYTLLSVEGDVRVFNKIDRDELLLLKLLFNRHSYGEVLKQLFDYRKKAPKEHFRSVVKLFREWLAEKVKRKFRR